LLYLSTALVDRENEHGQPRLLSSYNYMASEKNGKIRKGKNEEKKKEKKHLPSSDTLC